MKKGFTLVELLAVILILSLLALIVGVGVTRITKRAKSDLTHAQELAILDAAEVWSASNLEDVPQAGCIAVSINELIESGAIGDLKMNSFDDVDKDLNVVKICATQGSNNNIKVDYELAQVTDENCFTTADVTGGVSITGYKFDNTSCPRDVIIPNTIRNKTVKEIGYEAFFALFLGVKLTSVIIPREVIIIGGGAFSGNILTAIVIPNSVTTIGPSAFAYNKLTILTIPNSVTTIGPSAFKYNNLTKVNIGNGVTTIGASAFDGNTSFGYGPNELTSVIINTSKSDVTQGSNAFGWASGYDDSNIVWLRGE